MPTKVNVELIVVWACVGFFTGAGWAVATWLAGRILGLNSSLIFCTPRPLSRISGHSPDLTIVRIREACSH